MTDTRDERKKRYTASSKNLPTESPKFKAIYENLSLKFLFIVRRQSTKHLLSQSHRRTPHEECRDGRNDAAEVLTQHQLLGLTHFHCWVHDGRSYIIGWDTGGTYNPTNYTLSQCFGLVYNNFQIFPASNSLFASIRRLLSVLFKESVNSTLCPHSVFTFFFPFSFLTQFSFCFQI